VCGSGRSPVMFCCGHTTCYDCSTRVVSCPTCRHKITQRYMAVADFQKKKRKIYGSKLSHTIDWVSAKRGKKVIVCSQYCLPGPLRRALCRDGHRVGSVRFDLSKHTTRNSVDMFRTFARRDGGVDVLLVSGYWNTLPYMPIKCDHVLVVSHICGWYISAIHSRLRAGGASYDMRMLILNNTIESMLAPNATSRRV
jgi:hypothetical protein